MPTPKQAFQLTRSRGAWRLNRWMTTAWNGNFNSHAHVERDFFIDLHAFKSDNFNSHAHVERDLTLCHRCGHLWHFNSHAHVERDNAPKNTLVLIDISTHTLTWSVTFVLQQLVTVLQFQLTRSRGAWQISIGMSCFFNNFNSHAHVERDGENNSSCYK